MNSQPAGRRRIRIPSFSPIEAGMLDTDWPLLARTDQYPPDGDWATWLILGGRGSGKTRSGAEWVLQKVRDGARHIALIAPTLHDAREVMLSGESGLLNIGYKQERPVYQPTRRRVVWPDFDGQGGATGYLFSAHEPDRLRGPQFDCAWGDEFCAWTDPDAVLSNLRLGLRLGDDPRLCLTTTPRPLPALDRVLSSPSTRVTRSRTRDNQDHLAPGFLKSMTDLMGGTALGRQELDGDIIRDDPHAIFKRDTIDKHRKTTAPSSFDRVLVAIDPPSTSGSRADACGIVVVGRDPSGPVPKAYVLHDGSREQVAPADWARAAIELYDAYGADAILAETNQGGDMIATIIAQYDNMIPVIGRHATRSKSRRALPVSLLYERGRVHHVGTHKALEDELCSFGSTYQRGSPDRMDALVWAVSELLLNRIEPRLRFL